MAAAARLESSLVDLFLGGDGAGQNEMVQRSLGGEAFSVLAVASTRKLVLLRARLLRESPKRVLRILYVEIGPLRGSSSVELGRSVLLRAGAPRS